MNRMFRRIAATAAAMMTGLLIFGAAACRPSETVPSNSGLSEAQSSSDSVSSEPTKGPDENDTTQTGVVLKDIPLDFGVNEWQFVWSYNVLDTKATTASLEICKPVLRDAVMTYGEAWEGDGCCYQNFFWDESAGIYRMYYKGLDILDGDNPAFKAGEFKVCYAESADGINWTKPNLGLYAYNGSKNNNIILDTDAIGWAIDNCFIFMDPNPACPKDQKYKALAGNYEKGLYCYFSADGIHFDPKKYTIVTTDGAFDTLNTAFWSESDGLYYCFIRGFHGGKNIRDIRVLTSKDFKSWTSPKIISCGENAEDYPMYTNNASPYYRNPKIMIGFPTRYEEYTIWGDSFDELSGREHRLFRMKVSQRYGLALTDCAFMTSLDGSNWKRYDEAIFTPGSENPLNWVYGDCLPAYGMLETPSVVPGADPELSMYMAANHFTGQAKVLYRYTLRVDGFAACVAPFTGAKVVTKEFVCPGGSDLSINFATSAKGYVRVSLVSETGDKIDSERHFGDSIDRTVLFTAGRTPEDFKGKKVHLEMEMLDASLYSFRFNP